MNTCRGVWSSGRGFALIELAFIVVVGGALLALLLAMGADTRRQSRLGQDIANLGRIGSATYDYAADSADLFWSYSWKKGQSLSQWPELNNASSDMQAAANQAVDILRRRGVHPNFPTIPLWFPHALYNHLVLADSMGGPLPDFIFISAADSVRLTWARNPHCPFGLPCDKNPVTMRWPCSSSYMTPATFYDRSPVGSRVSQGSTHNFWSIPGGSVLGRQPLSAIAFPSSKVVFHDSHARHFGSRVAYCGYPEARVPLLFGDSSVSVRTTADANPGWQANQPASPNPTSFQYAPGPPGLPGTWEPPTMNGQPSELIESGRYRWTRGTPTEHGVAGRDFGGPETCSGQPGCP